MIWLADEIAKPLRLRGRSEVAQQLNFMSSVSEMDAKDMLAVSAAITVNHSQQ
jgi:hypothetical protein